MAALRALSSRDLFASDTITSLHLYVADPGHSISPLLGMPALRALSLEGSFRDLRPLLDMPRLRSLTLDCNYVYDVDVFGCVASGLTALTRLEVLGYGGQSLDALQGLAELDLTCDYNTEPDITGLGNLRKLRL